MTAFAAEGALGEGARGEHATGERGTGERGTPARRAGASPSRYAGAGVDIAAGEEAVRRIGPAVRSTYGPEVLGDLGSFAGLFALPAGRWRQPVLVSGADGVGTKTMVASMAGRYDTVGIDLVAMCVDDVVCTGAEPLFMLDYYSTGRLDPDVAEAVVRGVVEGCRRAGCALLGGEMAEHPGGSGGEPFDLAGFAVGAVERDAILGPSRVRAGDLIVGLASPGLRSNGYSLARQVLLQEAGRPLDGPAWPGASRSLADELLEPSVIYAPAVVALASGLPAGALRSAAHVTGGGIVGNLPRALPASLDARLDRSAWEVPRIFREIEQEGRVPPEEMLRVFNMGLGMTVVVDRDAGPAAAEMLSLAGHRAALVGEVVEGAGRVRMEA